MRAGHPTWYPTYVEKTSVYLGAAGRRRLRWIAEREGISQAEALRRALDAYRPSSDRDFVGARSGEGPGGSVADVDRDELLRGFGS